MTDKIVKIVVDDYYLREALKYIKEQDHVTMTQLCVELDIGTAEAREILGVLFALGKISLRGYSVNAGTKWFPTFAWVATKGRIRNLTPTDLQRKAKRKRDKTISTNQEQSPPDELMLIKRKKQEVVGFKDWREG